MCIPGKNAIISQTMIRLSGNDVAVATIVISAAAIGLREETDLVRTFGYVTGAAPGSS